jgi:succinoglycan biosynthesis protein ExoL
LSFEAPQLWDYVFVCSNRPTPRSVEKLNAVVESGRSVVLIYLDRIQAKGESDLYPLPPPVDCQVLRFPVSHGGVGWRRTLEMWRFARWFRSLLAEGMVGSGGTLYVDSLDLLAAAVWVSSGCQRDLIWEVRDLHRLQLSRGATAAAVRLIEHRLLASVRRLVLTSQEYARVYFDEIFSGSIAVVENWPSGIAAQSEATDFRDSNVKIRFQVGYVGVVRYLECVSPLLRALGSLQGAHREVGLLIAGGGDLRAVLGMSGDLQPWLKLTGPFEYGREIGSIYRQLDLNFAVYDPAVSNVQLALPNKLYESMIFRVPIMVSKGTFLATRVAELGIGVAVDPYDAMEMEERISEAMDGAPWYTDALATLQQMSVPTEEARARMIRDAVLI